MSDNADFLKFLITEDVYVISEKTAQSSSNLATKEGGSTSSDSYQPNSEILVLFEGNVTDEMPLGEIEFLSKILTAVNCSLDQVDIRPSALNIPLAKYKKIIAFGGLNDPDLQKKYMIHSKGGSHVMTGDTLQLIANSQDLKKSLWGALKQMFG